MEEALRKLNADYEKKCAELREFEKQHHPAAKDAFVKEDLKLRRWYESELVKIRDKNIKINSF